MFEEAPDGQPAIPTQLPRPRAQSWCPWASRTEHRISRSLCTPHMFTGEIPRTHGHLVSVPKALEGTGDPPHGRNNSLRPQPTEAGWAHDIGKHQSLQERAVTQQISCV